MPPKTRRDPVPGAPTRRGPTAAPGARTLPGWVPPAVYAAAVVGLFHEFFTGQATLLGTDTFALSYFAREFYTEFVRSFHRIPLWNPLLFGGLPFVDGMHGDIFYPPSLALFFLDAEVAWGWKMVLHVFLAGLFTYLWLRELGVGQGSALFGGLVYMLGADLVSLVYPGGDGKLFVSALAPLAFWLTERAAARRRLADFAALGLGVTLLVLTSHMQLAYFTVWGISLYFLFRVAQRWRAERRTGAAAQAVGLFALAGTLGVGAAAVQFVPPLLYLREWSHRAGRTVEAERTDAYAYSTTWSLHPEEAAALVVPEFVGDDVQTAPGEAPTYWGRNPFKINHEYAGLVPLLLAPLLFLRRRDPRAGFFAVLGGLALLYALGASTPAFRLFYLIPGVRLFRAPSLIIFLYGLSVATLGALALERFLAWARGTDADRRAARRLLWGATAALAALALLASTGALTDAWRAVLYPELAPAKAAALEQNLPRIRAGFWIATAIAATTATLFELLARGILGRNVALAALALLAALDLWRVDRHFVRATVAMNAQADPVLFDPDPSLRYLQEAQVRGEVFRAFDPLGAYPPNAAAVHGIEQLAGHHGNEIGRYRELIGGEQAANVAASELRLLDLLNVAYLLVPGPVELPGYTEVFRGPRTLVYRNERALPRAFLVGRVEVVPDDRAVARILSPDFDFRQVAALPRPLPPGTRVEPEPRGSVHWLERQADRQRLRVSTDRPALLVLTDNYYPAWQARLDGRPVPLLRANYAFRAVPIPTGEHLLELEYRSRVLQASAWCSAAVLLVLLGTVAAGVLRTGLGEGGAGKGGGGRA